MKKLTFTFSTITLLLFFISNAWCVPFTPDFSDYPFPGTQYTVDAAANAHFSENYGITIDNAYLYKDSRDTFDGIGVSVGEVSEIGTSQIGTITFLDTTNYVSLDYWSIYTTTYSAFNSSDVLIDTFTVGNDQLGSYLFSTDTDRISYVTWAALGGFGQISGLEYDYDGVTDGTNTDLDNAPVPEPATMLLLSTGIAGFAAVRRRKNK